MISKLVSQGDLRSVRIDRAVRVCPADLAACVATRAVAGSSWVGPDQVPFTRYIVPPRLRT